MEILGELVSDRDGTMVGFGRLSKDEPLIIDEFKMVKIEALMKCRIGEIPMPPGVTFTFLVNTD